MGGVPFPPTRCSSGGFQKLRRRVPSPFPGFLKFDPFGRVDFRSLPPLPLLPGDPLSHPIESALNATPLFSSPVCHERLPIAPPSCLFHPWVFRSPHPLFGTGVTPDFFPLQVSQAPNLPPFFRCPPPLFRFFFGLSDLSSIPRS